MTFKNELLSNGVDLVKKVWKKEDIYIISKEFYSKTIEAIGPEVLNFKEILQILMKCIKKKRIFDLRIC